MNIHQRPWIVVDLCLRSLRSQVSDTGPVVLWFVPSKRSNIFVAIYKDGAETHRLKMCYVSLPAEIEDLLLRGDALCPIIFSSPEPKAHLLSLWVGYKVGIRRPSYIVVRRPHSLNIFSSETTGPIKVKFHTELLWDRGTNICSNGPGHMTNMAAMPIYIKKK